MEDSAVTITDKAPWWSSPSSQARVLADSEDIRNEDIKPLLQLRGMLVGPHFGGGGGDELHQKPTNNMYAVYAKMKALCLGGNVQCVSGRLLWHRVRGKQSRGKCFHVGVDVHQR